MKPRKCRQKAPGCHGEYTPWTGHILRQGVCQNAACLLKKAEANRNRKEAKERSKSARERNLKKEALKTRADHLDEAQKACNEFIRLRDADKPCISCGKAESNKYDAGHFVTVGSCSELRFHPMNIHKQCSWDCNKNKSGNIIEYRKALVKLIGVDNVEWLENHHDYYSWTIEDAKEIRAHYREETKRMRKSST